MRKHSTEWQQFWRRHIFQFERSGLSYRQYAKQHGLNYRQLHRHVTGKRGLSNETQAERERLAVELRAVKEHAIQLERRLKELDKALANWPLDKSETS